MAEETGNMPVFVKIDDYKNIIEVLDLLKMKLAEARQSLEKIAELKNQEDAELEQWESELEEVERKIDFIDSTLFEPGAL